MTINGKTLFATLLNMAITDAVHRLQAAKGMIR